MRHAGLGQDIIYETTQQYPKCTIRPGVTTRGFLFFFF
jgi:hypothetical protein